MKLKIIGEGDPWVVNPASIIVIRPPLPTDKAKGLGCIVHLSNGQAFQCEDEFEDVEARFRAYADATVRLGRLVSEGWLTKAVKDFLFSDGEGT